jgi:hypothetical protein
MTAGPFIAAFDVATATGVCDGACGGTPRVFTWYLDDAGKERARKLCYFRRLLDKYFAENHAIEAVYYEAPVNIRAMMRIGATDETIALLRGAVGVLESCAVHAGIQCVEPVPVQNARDALTGQRTFKRVNGKSTAKDAIIGTAKTMGVKVENEHEADSFAVWWYACALHNPRIAHVSQPLFAR